MESIVSFGYWVRRRRKALDLTQATLAQQVGCSVAMIRKIESDERRPSRQMAELLADHLVIPEEERDKFLRMARGKFVASMISPIEAIRSPAFLPKDEVSPTDEDIPFVAREKELAQLNAFLELALANLGRVIFVTGEAGRGKTALAQEFVRRALERHADLVVASGYGNAYSGIGDPYLPFREILGLLTGDLEAKFMAGRISQTQAQRLWDLMPSAIQALLNVGSDLIDTLVSSSTLIAQATVAASGESNWIDQLEGVVARKAAGQGPPSLRQGDLFEQYAKVVQMLARQRPLLLVLDDLQWADAGSIGLLFHLGRRLQGSRILIVGIYRPADVAIGRDGERHPLEPIVNEFQRHFGDIKVDLGQANGRQFVELFLDTEPNQLGPEFREALYQHTKGHALFTAEMLRGMQERGDLVQDQAGCWIEGPHIDWETLPARVEGVIGERIDRLPTKLQEALKVASVEGEDFAAEVVARVLAVKKTEIIRQLSAELDKQHRLVRGQHSQLLGTKRLSHYRFRHILIQRYLYSSVDVVECAYLHQAVGNELEQLYGEQTEEIAVKLARHFEAAGLMDKAIKYLYQAGQRAVRLSANEEAIAQFSHALDLREALPDTPERIQQELDLQMALGAPLTATKGYSAPELEQAFYRARELTQQVRDQPRLFHALYGLWAYHHSGADLQLARELAQQMLELAQRQQDTSLLMPAYWAVGNTRYWMGEFASAQEYLEQSMALYDPQQHHSHVLLYGQDQGVTCLSFQAWTLWYLGYPDQALKRCQEAVALAQELAHQYSLVYAINWTTQVHLKRREWKAGQKQAEVEINLATEQGFPFWVTIGNMLRGMAIARQGQLKEGIALARKGVDDYQALGAQVSVPYFLAFLVDGYRQVGQIKEGLRLATEALVAIEKSGEHLHEAELYRLKGELLQLQGADESEVERHFLKAIDVSCHQRAKSLELRAATSLGRLWRKQGKNEDARQTVAGIYDWFTEGFDTADLKEARALLAALA